MICANCGSTMIQNPVKGGWNCTQCPVFTVPQPVAGDGRLPRRRGDSLEGSVVSEGEPEPCTGIPVYQRVRKLEERVAKLESYVEDQRRRSATDGPAPDNKYLAKLRQRGLHVQPDQFPASGSSFRDGESGRGDRKADPEPGRGDPGETTEAPAQRSDAGQGATEG